MRCYIAGPMAGVPDLNQGAFNNAALLLKKAGATVYNPVEMDTVAGDTTTFDSVEQQLEYAHDPRNARRYARRDLHVLTDILKAEDGDVVVMLEGWRESVGARAEFHVAEWVGLDVVSLETALRRISAGT